MPARRVANLETSGATGPPEGWDQGVSGKELSFCQMHGRDLAAALELWTEAEGLTLRAVDSLADLERFLERNLGLSWIARSGDHVIGAVLCGHDGRRGYIHHLAVGSAHRNRGVGRELARHALEGLGRAGITKCHLFVRRDNEPARRFWLHLNWEPREDIWILSHVPSGDPNA